MYKQNIQRLHMMKKRSPMDEAVSCWWGCCCCCCRPTGEEVLPCIMLWQSVAIFSSCCRNCSPDASPNDSSTEEVSSTPCNGWMKTVLHHILFSWDLKTFINHFMKQETTPVYIMLLILLSYHNGIVQHFFKHIPQIWFFLL